MSISPTYANDFRAIGYPVRLYSGKDALENLPAELKRNRAKRAFIVCGRTVSRKTDLIAHMQRILGDNCVGVFDEMDKDTSISAVTAAAKAAKATKQSAAKPTAVAALPTAGHEQQTRWRIHQRSGGRREHGA